MQPDGLGLHGDVAMGGLGTTSAGAGMTVVEGIMHLGQDFVAANAPPRLKSYSVQSMLWIGKCFPLNLPF